jgi:hypothetical protein
VHPRTRFAAGLVAAVTAAFIVLWIVVRSRSAARQPA